MANLPESWVKWRREREKYWADMKSIAATAEAGGALDDSRQRQDLLEEIREPAQKLLNRLQRDHIASGSASIDDVPIPAGTTVSELFAQIQTAASTVALPDMQIQQCSVIVQLARILEQHLDISVPPTHASAVESSIVSAIVGLESESVSLEERGEKEKLQAELVPFRQGLEASWNMYKDGIAACPWGHMLSSGWFQGPPCHLCERQDLVRSCQSCRTDICNHCVQTLLGRPDRIQKLHLDISTIESSLSLGCRPQFDPDNPCEIGSLVAVIRQSLGRSDQRLRKAAELLLVIQYLHGPVPTKRLAAILQKHAQKAARKADTLGRVAIACTPTPQWASQTRSEPIHRCPTPCCTWWCPCCPGTVSPEDRAKYVLIVCDGLIGCGKTTLLDEIRGVEVFREPVAEHSKNSWWNLLVAFYEAMNMPESPAASQARREAVSQLENAIWAHHRGIAMQRVTHAITERSCASSLHVFCKTLQESGLLEKSLFDTYLADFREMEKNVCHQATLTVYFRLPVDEAMRRIRKRAKEEGRFFEKDITSEYLSSLHLKYEELYQGREDVIIIDSAQPTDEMRRDVADQLQRRSEEWRKVLRNKGFPASETEGLVDLIIGWFRSQSTA